MPLLVKAGKSINVAPGVVDYWLRQGYELDLNGDGIPDASPAGGRGITGTAITGGHLIVTYSDGSTQDLGQVGGSVVVDTDGVPYLAGS